MGGWIVERFDLALAKANARGNLHALIIKIGMENCPDKSDDDGVLFCLSVFG